MYTTKFAYTLNPLLLSQSPQGPSSSPFTYPSTILPKPRWCFLLYLQLPQPHCNLQSNTLNDVSHLQKPSYPTNTLNHSLPPNYTPPLTPPPPLTPTPTPLSCHCYNSLPLSESSLSLVWSGTPFPRKVSEFPGRVPCSY